MNSLFEILALRRPHGGKNERYVAEGIIAELLDGLEVFNDDKGSPMAFVYTTDSKSRTLFCAHLDTVHRDEDTPNPVIFDSIKKHAFKADGTALGADCGAGVWLLLKMAQAGVPGTYVWPLGEEKGGVGSKWLADNAEEFLKGFDRAIAFDRKGTDSVITHQGWGDRCCSGAFATALAGELTTLPHVFKPDSTGVYTDTAEWTHVIPECTNVSVGYMHEHTGSEMLDVGFLETLLAQCLLVEWEELPTERDPSVVEDSFSRWKGAANDIAFEDLYGLTEDEIAMMVWEEPDAIAAMLYRAANGKGFGDEVPVEDAQELFEPEWLRGYRCE